jgi:thiosulfate/3-mercaptopyruvate sulfurtransferase
VIKKTISSLSILLLILTLGTSGFSDSIAQGFVKPQWLHKHLNDADLRVVAVTFEQSDYEKGHIPGSVFVDWRTDLADQEETRHYRIVSPEGFARTMERVGVSEHTTVVFYDDWNNRLAIRALWAAEYYGHANTAILEGGIWAWKQAGFTTTRNTPRYPRTTYEVETKHSELKTDLEFVRSHLDHSDVLIVDGRPEPMYTGMARGTVVHTGDKIERRGHIPKAVNLPWKLNIDNDDRFLDRDTLEALYASRGITGDVKTVFYCNEGVHAVYDWFVAYKILGFKNVTVYDGSLAEWTDYPELPLSIGN